MRWLVDAFNVVGARPDGWWRDRPAAVRRLLDRLEAYADRTGEDVRVVLDSGPPDLAGRRGGVAGSRREMSTKATSVVPRPGLPRSSGT